MATDSRGVNPHTGQPQGVNRESPRAPGSIVGGNPAADCHCQGTNTEALRCCWFCNRLIKSRVSNSNAHHTRKRRRPLGPRLPYRPTLCRASAPPFRPVLGRFVPFGVLGPSLGHLVPFGVVSCLLAPVSFAASHAASSAAPSTVPSLSAWRRPAALRRASAEPRSVICMSYLAASIADACAYTMFRMASDLLYACMHVCLYAILLRNQ
jgi:hypothetical protein